MATESQIRCRKITEPDFESVVDLLAVGFPDRPRRYWIDALALLQRRDAPEGCARYGYLLEAGGTAVGVHLQIFNTAAELSTATIRCQASAWYVEPQFRSHAALLIAVATRLKTVTYVNTTASPHTWPILEAVGFRRYTEGQFVSFPVFGAPTGARVSMLDERPEHRGLEDYDLLRGHERAGCLVLVCETPGGLKPFVFLRRRLRYAPVGVAQLVYCRDTADLPAHAGPLGRSLLRRGIACVICDANDPIPGLVGRFFRGKNPRFVKGPDAPKLNDLSYSETVLLGAAAGR
jgi:hypothetical protein